MYSHGFNVKLGKCMTMILESLANVVDLPYFVIHIFVEYRQKYYIGWNKSTMDFWSETFEKTTFAKFFIKYLNILISDNSQTSSHPEIPT